MHYAIAVCIAGTFLGGCVGGDPDNTLVGRVLLSDGTAAGDLVEAQMRVTAEQAKCSADLVSPEWFFDVVWPEGRPECIRDALHQHAPGNEHAIECAIEAYTAFVECMQREQCDVPEDFDESCDAAFIDQQEACPRLDVPAQDESQRCF